MGFVAVYDMKFYQFEYDSFKALIDASGKRYEEFIFAKKRGTLNIRFGENETFEFRRIENTLLDENKQWKETTDYIISIRGKKQSTNDFAVVETEFRFWLRLLDKP